MPAKAESIFFHFISQDQLFHLNEKGDYIALVIILTVITYDLNSYEDVNYSIIKIHSKDQIE